MIMWLENDNVMHQYASETNFKALKYDLENTYSASKEIYLCMLTCWGRVMHLWVNKLTIIGSDNGLLPDRRRAIIWTNTGIFIIGPKGANFSEILIEILKFSFKKMHLKVLSAKLWPFCLSFNVFKFQDHGLSTVKW